MKAGNSGHSCASHRPGSYSFWPPRVVTVGERSALSVCNVRMRVGLKEGMSFEQ